MNKPFNTYNGGKEASGVPQQIINLIPPHDTYIEGFVGNGAVLRYKKPAKHNFAFDLNPNVINKWKQLQEYSNTCFQCVDFMDIDASQFLLVEDNHFGRKMIYLDPPYLMSTRSHKVRLYTNEMSTQKQHIALLDFIVTIPHYVIISAYENELYDRVLVDLHKWSKHTFKSQTRSGTRTECVYFNYKYPKQLHEYGFLGVNNTERQRIQRKIQRHVDRLISLPVLERQAIIQAINASM